MKRILRRLSKAIILVLACDIVLFPLLALAQSAPSTTFLPMVFPAVIRMHAGSTTAAGIWSAETNFTNGSGSSTVNTTAIINTTLDPSPAPQAVYQLARVGNFTYTISSLTPGAVYPIKLHFAEIQQTVAGARQFNVGINGVQVLSNFDIFAMAGGANMAIERIFNAIASSAGTVTIQFANGTAGSALVNGIEVLPSISTTALNTGLYTVVSEATGLSLDSDNTAVSGSSVIQYRGQTGNTNQQWQVNKLPNGSYQLICISSGLALDSQGQTTAGTALIESTSNPVSPAPSQVWNITPTGSSTYTISSASNGLFMDSGTTANAGSVVTQATNTGSSSQRWTIRPVQIGAATPFVTYEAEWGLLGSGATVVSQLTPQPTEFVTPAIEASGRAFVQLSGPSSFVLWKNNTDHPISAINIRYSIPDSSTGGGINATLNLYVNGTFRQAIPMTSTQTWTYETDANYFGNVEIPEAGESAFEFWDEAHAMIAGEPVQPGQDIALRIDTQNTAAFYDIDSIDLETPPAPLSQPANSLSITSCGAVANDSSIDSTAPIQNCINQAESDGMSVWIPQGTFYLSNQLTADNVALEGAGMWYSTLRWNVLGTYTINGQVQNNQITGSGSTFENFAIDSNSNRETHKYGINLKGNNWLVNSVWVEHAGPSIWAQGTNGTVQNSRVNNSYADGINLNNGNGDAANGTNTGNNLTAINNFVRGTGDDGISINDASSNPPAVTMFNQMQNPTVIQNTIIAPWWANCLRASGGINVFVANNLTSGGSRWFGIDADPFAPIGGKFESGKIQGNIVFQAGGKHHGGTPQNAIVIGAGNDWHFDPTMVSNVIVRGNDFLNATFASMQVLSMQNGQFTNNAFNTPGTDGIDIISGSQGNAVFNNNSVMSIAPPHVAFSDLAAGTFSATGSGNTGFTPQ